MAPPLIKHRNAARKLLGRTYADALPDTHYSETMWRNGFASAERFFERLPVAVDVSGRDVLDVGCGTGNAAVLMARRGARRVAGIDYDPVEIDLGRERIAAEAPEVADHVELVCGADLEPLGDQDFDVVISKDSFEHYGEPEAMLAAMERRLRPGGLLAIGFGPLWNAPYGPHLDTRVPWLHHVIGEDVILERWNELRPGKAATTYEETGVNRMTLARFERMMAGSGLEQVALARNVSDHPAVRAMKVPARVPGLRELFVTNVYGVWRAPAQVSTSPR